MLVGVSGLMVATACLRVSPLLSPLVPCPSVSTSGSEREQDWAGRVLPAIMTCFDGKSLAKQNLGSTGKLT